MSDILAADRRHIWHPYTQHATEAEPIVVERAKGASLFTEDGTEILDLIASWWTCVHGHAHPEINKALCEQAERMEHVMFGGFTHKPAANLAAELARLLPGDLDRVFYSDNGSTAVEVALKVAYQYWRNIGDDNRTHFLALDGAYHGDTLGAMSVGRGCDFFPLFEGLMCPVEAVPYAETWEGDTDVDAREQAALAKFDAMLADQGASAAALIVEPLMQGAVGMRLCRPSFLRAVVEKARAYGILIIFDEVATGFGRTGTLFALEQVGVVPDLVCLSKGLTSGYLPLSATVARTALFETFMGETFEKALPHGHTFTANPLACAVALRSIELFEEEATLERVARIAARHKDQLPLLADHPRAARPRALGTLLAFDLVDGGDGYKSDASLALRDWYIANGLNIRPLGPAVYLMPPFCITDAELDRAYAALIEGLDQLD